MKISKPVIFCAGSDDMWGKENYLCRILRAEGTLQGFHVAEVIYQAWSFASRKDFQMNKISVATYVKNHVWRLCHLWLRSSLERTTISTNWNCIWNCCLLVGRWTLEVIGSNCLPAVIPWRAALLHCSTSQTKWVFTRADHAWIIYAA